MGLAIIAAAFSPIINVGASVQAFSAAGIIEASATRSPYWAREIAKLQRNQPPASWMSRELRAARPHLLLEIEQRSVAGEEVGRIQHLNTGMVLAIKRRYIARATSVAFRRRIWLTDTASGSMKPINLRIGKGSGRPRAADRCSHLVLAGGGTVPFGQFTATLRVEPDRYSSQCQRAGDPAAAPGRDAAAGRRVPAGADRGARRPRDVSTPIRSGAARENVRPAAASVTVDTIVARREERACRQEPT